LYYFQAKPLENFLFNSNFDVVFAEYGPTGVAAMDVCEKIGIPLVVHFHGYDAYQTDILKKDGKRYHELSKKASAIVVVSEGMKKQLISLGVSNAKIHLNPYGVETSLFMGANPLVSHRHFLFVGRFVHKKSPKKTVLAFHKVYESFPDAKLIMIGDGPLLNETRLLSNSLGLNKSVEFLGIQPHDAVAAVMREVRGYVQHSVTAPDGDSEGTPLAILEASSSGLPVVSTKHGGIVDAVIDGVTGYLIEEGDIAGMAHYMHMLAEDQKLAASMGSAGRKHIIENYSLPDRIMDLYNIIQSVT
jgi:glycosyltransferase involved in cell wall biosynthesis